MLNRQTISKMVNKSGQQGLLFFDFVFPSVKGQVWPMPERLDTPFGMRAGSFNV